VKQFLIVAGKAVNIQLVLMLQMTLYTHATLTHLATATNSCFQKEPLKQILKVVEGLLVAVALQEVGNAYYSKYFTFNCIYHLSRIYIW
jgi:hypothetical protein